MHVCTDCSDQLVNVKHTVTHSITDLSQQIPSGACKELKMTEVSHESETDLLQANEVADKYGPIRVKLTDE